jgi:murein DD-endopeptidase MepM/ murein hydrolase activator NlpD
VAHGRLEPACVAPSTAWTSVDIGTCTRLCGAQAAAHGRAMNARLALPGASALTLLASLHLLACGGEAAHDHGDETAAEAATATSPVPGRGVTTPFGRPGSLWAAGYHTGDDYAAPVGTRVVATRAGRVIAAGWNTWGAAYGQQVIVETDGIRHLYAHLSSLSVRTGDRVALGQELGRVGVTGNTTGPHCHYEERRAPYGYFDHRRPVFNKTAPGGSAPAPTTGGYLGWVFGRTSDDIAGLQRALASAGCAVDGGLSRTYDERTRRAVTCFQRRQGWSGADADGLVGPATAAKLFLVGDVYVDKLTTGTRGSDSVRMLQQRLNEVRHTALTISGTYDAATRDAVQAWQRSIGDSGRAADGNMGPSQSRLLFPAGRYDVR